MVLGEAFTKLQTSRYGSVTMFEELLEPQT